MPKLWRGADVFVCYKLNLLHKFKSISVVWKCRFSITWRYKLEYCSKTVTNFFAKHEMRSLVLSLLIWWVIDAIKISFYLHSIKFHPYNYISKILFILFAPTHFNDMFLHTTFNESCGCSVFVIPAED
jgi:hypothetical protein